LNIKLSETRNIILFIILCIIGETTYAFQKIGLKNALPFWVAGIRFSIAGIVMLIYIIIISWISYLSRKIIS
jgi:hypothetical protein